MEIYLKTAKKMSTTENIICIKDFAEVFAPPEILERVKNVKILEINSSKKKIYLISVLDIIAKIGKALPGHTVNSVGEMDTVVDYSPKKPRKSKWFPAWEWLKITFVTLILFGGASTAIMSFHTDAQIPTAFKNYYYIFFNERIENPMIIHIAYSIGLASGIIFFFNHISGKKITDDPTPIEVEMSLYEANVTDTMIDMLNSKRRKGGDSGDSL